MPIKFIKDLPNGLKLGLWEISETEDELLKLSGKALLPDSFGSIKSELQRKQTLAGRLLIKHLSTQVYKAFHGILKNAQGKPLLKNLNGHISISHSKNFAAATLHKQFPTGVDIEKTSARMHRVIPRVCSIEEQAEIKDDKTATFFWCAKEALYKLYGKEGMHFNKQLLVDTSNGYTGRILDEDQEINVELESMEFDDFVLVFATAKN